MTDQYITVIRITGHGGCGVSNVVSSCHIFVADTEEELKSHMKETMIDWLWKGDEKEAQLLSLDGCETLVKDRDNIINFIENEEKMVEVEYWGEQWENLNGYCEFTQIEEASSKFIPEYSLSAGKKAAITRKAIKEGKNPVMVHAGHKAAFTRKYG